MVAACTPTQSPIPPIGPRLLGRWQDLEGSPLQSSNSAVTGGLPRTVTGLGVGVAMGRPQSPSVPIPPSPPLPTPPSPLPLLQPPLSQPLPHPSCSTPIPRWPGHGDCGRHTYCVQISPCRGGGGNTAFPWCLASRPIRPPSSTQALPTEAAKFLDTHCPRPRP